MAEVLELKKIEERVYREIPMSRYMQVRVVSAALDQVKVAAPLAPNMNHEGTAFGGSVSSLALLSCWTLVNLNLETLPDLSFDYVVVQDSRIDFVRPIDSDFFAVASAETADGLHKFLETLKKHARARVSLKAEVSSASGLCAMLEARFVAQVTSAKP
jgi:thioesterase domain-containing protein